MNSIQIDTSDSNWTDEEKSKLIELVKVNPSLYHLKDKNLKQLKFTENVWTNLDLQLKKPPGSCKERWAMLRLQFRKEFVILERERHADENTTKRSKWKFYNQMQFVAAHLYRRGPTLEECIRGAVQGPTVDENSIPSMMSEVPVYRINDASNLTNRSITIEYRHHEEEYSPIETADPFKSRELHQLNAMSTPKGQMQPPPSRKIKSEQLSENADLHFRGVKIRKLSTVQTKESSSYNEKHMMQLGTSDVNRMNVTGVIAHKNFKVTSSFGAKVQKKEHPPCTCDADTDSMFLQSLLPEMKALNAEQKLQFKISVHQTLKNLLYSNANGAKLLLNGKINSK